MEKIKNHYVLTTIIVLIVATLFLGFNINKDVAAKNPVVLKENKLFDKVIVIGDSRMELIANKKNYTHALPQNMYFIAKGGEKKEWFINVAVKEMSEYLKNFNGKKAVVVNMGVNDLQASSSSVAVIYNQTFNMLAQLYPDTMFFIMSVNPINEDLMSKNNKRTNTNIEKFNQIVLDNIKSTKYKNLKYCDAYNEITFETRDGIHFTSKTNKKIIDYILNDCLKK